jgi:hypothetical protein
MGFPRTRLEIKCSEFRNEPHAAWGLSMPVPVVLSFYVSHVSAQCTDLYIHGSEAVHNWSSEDT